MKRILKTPENFAIASADQLIRLLGTSDYFAPENWYDFCDVLLSPDLAIYVHAIVDTEQLALSPDVDLDFAAAGCAHLALTRARTAVATRATA